MAKELEYGFAQSAVAEAPAVISYILALAFFSFVWSSLSPPTISVAELRLGAVTKSMQKH
jgi:hypothetical protein